MVFINITGGGEVGVGVTGGVLTFPILFLSAFFIAKVFDVDSAAYLYHMIFRIGLVLVVALRIFWGIFGSRHARFSSYALKPLELLNYFKSLITSKGPTYLEHNPATSWTALTMMLMALDINKDFYEDIH